jgi:organic hydroperoxide reductase OsmC/OhrA
VVLHPDIGWEGRVPSPAEIAVMHERAHHMCFIANSVKTEIVVAEPVGA